MGDIWTQQEVDEIEERLGLSRMPGGRKAPPRPDVPEPCFCKDCEQVQCQCLNTAWFKLPGWARETRL